MSIKGFSTQKKLDTELVGYNDKQTKDTSEFATFQKTSSDKVALDTAVSSAFRLHPAAKTVEANSTQRIIKITAHGAQKNDYLRFELSSQNPYFEAGIVSVPDADTLVLAAELPNTPNVGDQFYLLRYAQQRVDSSGAGIVALAPSPIMFDLNGVDTEVSKDTTNLNNSNPLPTEQIFYKSDGTKSVALATENGAAAVGNAVKKFRDGFASLAQDAAPDAAIWSGTFVNQGTGFVGRRGNAAGSSYMNISMCPFTPGFEYKLDTVRTFKYPMRFMVGHSMSQRISGQEVEMSIVGVDGSGVVENLTPIADMTISGNITVATNVATINFATAHPYKGGDRIILKNNADIRMNVGPVIVTVVTATQITVPLTIANGTYTAGGSVEWADPFSYSKNAVGIINESTTVTTATWATRRNGYNTRLLQAQTVASSTATQSNTSPYSDAFNSAARHEFTLNQEESLVVSRTQDSLVAPSGNFRWSQGIPDEELEYKIRIRAKNLNNIVRPIARIVSIAKTGTTTATVTTDVAHNLTTSSWVQIFGVRDQTNFPNLAAATVVASIVSPTQFTIVIGTASTTSSAGGAVILNNGSVLAPTYAGAVQSISRTNNILTLIGTATWATPLPGENVHLYGCDATSMGLYDGAYKVLRVSTTTLELESVGADFVSINCGGTVIKRTDVRLHFVSEIEYTRLIAELSNQNGASDSTKSLPVVTTSGTLTSVGTVTTVSAVTSANLALPGIIADVASAAITTTATTSALTPTFGSNYEVNIPVTVVSGTNPTLDVVIQESDDSGTNWYDVYHFPRITATGMYRSPILPLQGNRVRYVQTVGGTTPSFTRAVNRLQLSTTNPFPQRQLFDRVITVNTINSTTAALLSEMANSFNLTVSMGAITTTAPIIGLEGSEDGSAWYDMGSRVLAVANTTTSVPITGYAPKFVRAKVFAAGSGATLNYLLVKAFNGGIKPANDGLRNMSAAATTSVGTTAITEIAPADAVAFSLYCPNTNTGTVYWNGTGATATASNSMGCDAGRSYENIPYCGNLSLIASAAAQSFILFWHRR